MFPSGLFDFFYAPHNQVASTVMNMTFSLTDPFTAELRPGRHEPALDHPDNAQHAETDGRPFTGFGHGG